MTSARDVIVRLRMEAGQYIATAAAAGRATRGLASDTDKVKKASQAVTPVLMGAGMALGGLGAAGGALKAVPPALGASVAAAAVLPAVLGGAAASAAVLKIGLSGVSDALGSILEEKDPFKRLTPNARELATSVARNKDALLGVKAQLQSRVTRGMGADLDLFASKTLPAVQGGLNELAHDWADTAASLAVTLADDEVLSGFNRMTRGADQFFDKVNTRILPTGRSLATLTSTAAPIAEEFGDGLISLIDRFNAKVESARADGSLGKLFEDGAESGKQILSILGSITRMTGMVIAETNRQNDATAQLAVTLKGYTESGRAAGDIAGIVNLLTTASENLADVIAPIGSVLRDGLADPATAQSVGQMLQILAAGSRAVATLVDMFLALNGATGGVLLTAVAFAAVLIKARGAVLAMNVAMARASTGMAAYGAGGARAARGMQMVVAGAGKAVIALVALQAAHAIVDEMQGGAVNVDLMADSLERLGMRGQVTGEMATRFGDDLGDLKGQLKLTSDAAEGGFAGFASRLESAIPIAGDLLQAFGVDTFASSKENFAGLDQAMSQYIAKTGNTVGAQAALNEIVARTGIGMGELSAQIPATAKALTDANLATTQLQMGTAGLAEKQALLNAPIKETVTLVRSMIDVFNEMNGVHIGFAQATIDAEASVDALAQGLGKNGLALEKNRNQFDLNTEKGRQNLTLTLAVAEAAAKAAKARMDDNGTVEQGAAVYDAYINRLRRTLAAQGASPKMIDAIINRYAKMPKSLEGASAAANDLAGSLKKIPKGTTFRFDGKQLVNGKGQTLDLKNGIKGIPAGKKFTWNGKSLVDAKGKAYDVKAAVEAIPKTRKVTVNVATPGLSAVRVLDGVLDGLPGTKTVRINVTKNVSSANAAEHAQGRAKGGVTVQAAANGLLRPQIAPPGTLYQWAEEETGGELFLPRKGIDRQRGRQLLEVGAQWYGGMFVPLTAMAAGGVNVRAAASGLVNVQRREPVERPEPVERASRLDFAEAYLRAREAVKSLSASLKENGRSLSANTAKGQQNRGAVFSLMRAAQDAAKVKYDETGSVTKANAVYAEHIRRLRAVLAQQKVNAASVRAIMSLGGRPKYDIPETPPKPLPALRNSANNVAYARARISAAGGLTDLRDSLSLNLPTATVGTKEGRENLSGILDFLGQAQAVAQSQFDRTGNAKGASHLYSLYIVQLRKALTANGYSAKQINSMVNAYGKITLERNQTGGLYMAAGGLAAMDKAQLFSGTGATMYGFAEAGTGGEAFIPRIGDRARSRELLDTAAGWYGGRVSYGGQGPGGGGTVRHETNMTVNNYGEPLSPGKLQAVQRQADVRNRTGRPK